MNATQQPPLLHCVGAGRAARTLLRLLVQQRQIRLGWVVNRSLHSAQQAVAFIGAGEARATLPQQAAGEGLLLGVPESQLQMLAEQIQQQGQCQGLTFAFHLSASRGSAVLQGLAPQLASCHPALAFANPEQALAQFSGSWCVLEGTAELVQMLSQALQGVGTRVIAVPGLDKRRYHAAAMAASNFILATLGLAERLALSAGLPASESQQLLNALALRNLQAAQQHGTAAAFTGPLERGDVAAVQYLLEALAPGAGSVSDATVNSEDAAAWVQLLKLCIPLVEAKKGLSQEQRTRLQHLFEAFP